jgi:glycosyltransferase involved in cell wall biosynthesis
MRVFYADTGLSQDLGHHANSCRLMAAEWRSRGCEVIVAAAGNVSPSLQAELNARPHFRVHTYWQGDGDPFCGWLTAFFEAAGRTQEDLAALGPFTPDDLLYVNSIQPGQLMALAGFVRSTPAAAPPRIVAELGTAPGLDFEWRNDMLQFNAKDPRYDAKGVLYRFAATHLAASPAAEDPILTTFHATCSAIYSQLLLRRVQTLPLPHQAMRPIQPRPSRERVTIGVLGHQRADKGYHLVPEIALALLDARPSLQLLLHNGAPGYMHMVQDVVRDLAANDPRIIADERIADGALWESLLDCCDIVLCPYHAPSYTGAYSAIVGEAISHGIPLIVPGVSTLSRTLTEFGSPGATFPGHDVPSIVEATLKVIDDLPTYTARAEAAARRWQHEMGASRTVDAILHLIGKPVHAAASEPERKVA